MKCTCGIAWRHGLVDNSIILSKLDDWAGIATYLSAKRSRKEREPTDITIPVLLRNVTKADAILREKYNLSTTISWPDSQVNPVIYVFLDRHLHGCKLNEL